MKKVNKVNKIHTFRFKPSFFDENVLMVWGGNFKEMCGLIEEIDELEAGTLHNIAIIDDCDGLATQNPLDTKSIYILLEKSPKEDLGLFIHELMHSMIFVVELVGVSPTDSGGEWFAYWVQDYIVQLLDNKLL